MNDTSHDSEMEKIVANNAFMMPNDASPNVENFTEPPLSSTEKALEKIAAVSEEEAVRHHGSIVSN